MTSEDRAMQRMRPTPLLVTAAALQLLAPRSDLVSDVPADLPDTVDGTDAPPGTGWSRSPPGCGARSAGSRC
jgi:hypothetical protein